ncbi:MAG: B12-binding domain-containing radical SAM protein [Nitrospirota bacterium]|nr:B12-binding domain-containing radical SAM protein [Nitrospirota bacterium]
MSKKKILFITPPYHAGVVEVAGKWVPLYLVYLAGAARKAGYHVAIFDAMTKDVGYAEIEQKIRSYKPDFIAASVFTCTAPDATLVVETAKKVDPSIKTILGGVHASFMYEEMFSNTDALDFIVRGEGEQTIVELLDAVTKQGDLSRVKGIVYRDKGGLAVTPERPLMENLDNQPMAWDLLDWNDYHYFVIPGSRLGAVDTSRGCDKECTFCSQQKYWKQKWRARSPEDIVREMLELRDKYGVDVVLFTDDYPTPDRARWEKLLDLLIEKQAGQYILMETRAADIIRDEDILHKYRQAGIIHIYVGTEATDQKSLDYIKKDLSTGESKKALALCRKHGIITETSMILGFPDETEDSIARTLELVMDFNPDMAHFLAIAPWPYSDIYKDLEPYIVVKDYRKYNLIDPILKPKNMTLEEVDKAIVDCYRAFYMNRYAEMTLQERDEFKKKYMVTAMKLMMSNSFIKKKIGATMGEMPPEVRKIIESAEA